MAPMKLARRSLLAVPLFVAAKVYAQPRGMSLVGDGIADDSFALRILFNQSRNSRLVLPAGKFRITQPIKLDPNATYSVTGQGADPNASTGTVIINDGPGPAIEIAGTLPGVDKFISLSDFMLYGRPGSGPGIACQWVHGLKLDRLWISDMASHSIVLEDSWGCKLSNVVTSRSGGDGIRIMRRANLVSLRDCTFNGSRGANIRVSGSAPNESLAVTIDSCDFSVAPEGLVLEHVWSVRVVGSYSEGCPTIVRADSTVRGLTFQGNYLQDGVAIFDRVEGLNLGENTLNAQTKPTELRLRLSPGSRIGRNHLAQGAREIRLT